MVTTEEYYLRILNHRCPASKNRWEYDEPVFKLKVMDDEMDMITKWVQSIVDCSFFYESHGGELWIMFTKSTLENKLKL
ncbi:MAG: hypothetical protein IJH63_00640 [Methanobrevibacter sp.]|nr:hypothetical protein [Methanosphaera sp.]MBR0369211.1 hypothetical protein [Methanobrevibacter sp.]